MFQRSNSNNSTNNSTNNSISKSDSYTINRRIEENGIRECLICMEKFVVYPYVANRVIIDGVDFKEIFDSNAMTFFNVCHDCLYTSLKSGQTQPLSHRKIGWNELRHCLTYQDFSSLCLSIFNKEVEKNKELINVAYEQLKSTCLSIWDHAMKTYISKILDAVYKDCSHTYWASLDGPEEEIDVGIQDLKYSVIKDTYESLFIQPYGLQAVIDWFKTCKALYLRLKSISLMFGYALTEVYIQQLKNLRLEVKKTIQRPIMCILGDWTWDEVNPLQEDFESNLMKFIDVREENYMNSHESTLIELLLSYEGGGNNMGRCECGHGKILTATKQCTVCKHYSCEHCLKIKQPGHICNQEDVDTVKELRTNARNCPSCGVWIHKSNGCDVMFCTNPHCNITFNYVTGERLYGNLHNPHRMERQRELGHTDTSFDYTSGYVDVLFDSVHFINGQDKNRVYKFYKQLAGNINGIVEMLLEQQGTPFTTEDVRDNLPTRISKPESYLYDIVEETTLTERTLYWNIMFNAIKVDPDFYEFYALLYCAVYVWNYKTERRKLMFDFIDALTVEQQKAAEQNFMLIVQDTLSQTLNIQNSISELMGDSYYVVNLISAIDMAD